MKHQTISQTISALFKYLCLLVFCCLLAGCDVNVNIPTTSASTGNNPCQSNCTVGTGASSLNVIVEPDAGTGPLVDAIRGAQKSVWMEMYLLTISFPYLTLHNSLTSGLSSPR